MERCDRCGVSGEEVRLFDAIYEGRMSSLCERCSIIENIPIIRKPRPDQLRETERDRVYDRMKMLAGMRDRKTEETFFPEDRLKELDKNPKLELPEGEQLNLIDHFHWEIMKNRRRRGMSQNKLADTLGESEVVIQMIEKGKLPENSERLIKKLEQFFQVRLRKVSILEEIENLETREQKPVLLDEMGNELEVIPEPELETYSYDEDETGENEEGEDMPLINRVENEIEIGTEETESLKNSEEKLKPEVECRVEEFDYKKKMVCERVEDSEPKDRPKSNPVEIDAEIKDLDLKRTDLRSVTINDLRRLHEKKLVVSQQEKAEEQKKIEERNRLIEARKEEMRTRKEQESKNLDNVLGGSELLQRERKGFDEII